MKRLALAVMAGGLVLAGTGDRVGLPAPPLELAQWLYSPPLEMKSLKGKVVLVR